MDFQSDFSPGELAGRRLKLADTLQGKEVALLPGGADVEGSDVFRQVNDFYYLCGVVVPHCYLLIEADGVTTIFVPESAQPPFDCANSDWIRETTGLDQVLPLVNLSHRLQNCPVVYFPSREGEGRKMSRDNLWAWRKNVLNDPFDGRRGRNGQIAVRLRENFPLMELRDLSPALDEMRLIKSATELKLLRRAGELTGLGAAAAMRATQPGIMEYELHAELDYVYLKGGAAGDAYNPIIPGSSRAGDAHYFANDSQLDDGDIVLLDCAPDYRYYTSDIGRMWPVNGVFDPAQRALYGYVLAYHKEVLSQIRPGRMMTEIHQETAERMRPVFEKWEFVSDGQRETARILFDFQGHISHGVGMCVHDVSLHRERPLEAGMVFAVDPMAWDHERETYYRVEDTVAVTEDGHENLTAKAPIEIDDIEAHMRSS